MSAYMNALREEGTRQDLLEALSHALNLEDTHRQALSTCIEALTLSRPYVNLCTDPGRGDGASKALDLLDIALNTSRAALNPQQV